MTGAAGAGGVEARLVDALYVDAMVLADEAKAYFEQDVRADRDALSPATRVLLSCESLRVTTRLMHVLAWLLTRRAVRAGELTEEQARVPSRQLGSAPEDGGAGADALPPEARRLLGASAALYGRAARLDRALDAERSGSPALDMLRRLSASL